MNKISKTKYRQVIVLAGGKGTRMNIRTAKCAYLIKGVPMITRICNAIDKCKFNKKIVVVGEKKEMILSLVPKDYDVAYQEKQIGTADAVKCAMPLLHNHGCVLIIPGDMPYLDKDILLDLLLFHEKNKNDISLASNTLANPYGYGRIIRRNNKVLIIEEKDATSEEKKINEVNSGVILVNIELLKDSINKITNNNNQKEFYLTDIINLNQDKKIGILCYSNDLRLIGINKLEDIL